MFRSRKSISTPSLLSSSTIATTGSATGRIYEYNFLSMMGKKRILFLLIILWMLYDINQTDDIISPVITSNAIQQDNIPVLFDSFIGSPESTSIEFGGSNQQECHCDLVSIDCLDTIRCLPVDEKTSLQQVYRGIVKRQMIQRHAIWSHPLPGDYFWAPLGKATQSAAITAWRSWLSLNTLPAGYDHHIDENICNATYYPYCMKHNLTGRSCYLEDFSQKEHYAEMERAALRVGGGGIFSKSAVAIEQELHRMQTDPFHMTSYEYLLGFSTMSRIAFSLRPHMLSIYQKRLKTIHPYPPQPTSRGNNKAKSSSSSSLLLPPLRVALHVRRGDACAHQLQGYSPVASLLDSKPQVSGERLCYETNVYLKALDRIQSLAGKDGNRRHLEVYIATDHMLSLLDEIKELRSDLYYNITWKYVDYSRQMFNYSTNLEVGSDFIEFADNQAMLGETAAIDIWHLSHAQVFVGHLGSRFGKLSWWQAMGRHSEFVPFFTVDGHSVCCDIDESCGRVAPTIVSMENCLTFSRDDSATYVVDPVTYWEEGSTVRWRAAVDEVKFWRRKFPGRKIPDGLYQLMNRSTTLFDN